MKRLLRVIKRITNRGGHYMGRLWRWAKKPGPHGESQRFAALTKWAERHEQLAWDRYREHHRAKDKRAALRWRKIRWVYNSRRVRAKRRWKRGQDHGPHGTPAYATWMLSGHSSNIDDDLKPVVAYVVAVRGQTVTDTYDYSGHAAGSYHYPRNDPTSPQQGHAIDSAGADMCGSMTATRDHFGQAHWLELFGPCNWYIKNGAQFGGMFPGHADHQHSAVA
jgi:hypothetical protein